MTFPNEDPLDIDPDAEEQEELRKRTLEVVRLRLEAVDNQEWFKRAMVDLMVFGYSEVFIPDRFQSAQKEVASSDGV